MIPEFDKYGLLPQGIHWATWPELVDRFGDNPWRLRLADGLAAALDELKRAGCRVVYVDGSFVTEKLIPNDFDACWDEAGVDPTLLDPALLTFDLGRATQKAKYLGELFPLSAVADSDGSPFIEFFQIDRETGRRKGIVAIDLEGWHD